MLKYDLIPEQLIYEGTINKNDLFCPDALPLDLAELVHEQAYITKLISLQLLPAEIRKSGFPLSAQLVHREFLIAGGTVQCCSMAMDAGIAFNIAGGTHHAHSNSPEGFCLLNDCAIAAAALLKNNTAKKILITDLDVHQGNGSAQIFTENKQVFTFSMHAGHNFPLKKEVSDLDISLPDGTGDDAYLSILEKEYDALIKTLQPDFIFYNAGVDVLATDKLGRLKLSRNGCKERDRIILNTSYKNRIPTVVTMGGGYSEK